MRVDEGARAGRRPAARLGRSGVSAGGETIPATGVATRPVPVASEARGYYGCYGAPGARLEGYGYYGEPGARPEGYGYYGVSVGAPEYYGSYGYDGSYGACVLGRRAKVTADTYNLLRGTGVQLAWLRYSTSQRRRAAQPCVRPAGPPAPAPAGRPAACR
ncbi:hypothetical protein IAG44_18255 [Streptomyces roseirectus]|uniref:Uncharacterized protein n=1 Tax=Streptomyces roseirectus TaxID=2768066 RepID=A0A7H0IEH3_9ACTN|nr:hypothetical protein [Streptomyces roseirectus]QNP71189.1 hypothetical protein IAG44_18255 [Streptomyces roseirectus]